ncbi:MAG: 4-hydroxy-3-methylbut-2-enyl diphosphate reductase [PVC group bacterium]
MKIITARKAGFCMGVRRALEMVLDRARREDGKEIRTYGPLIHNPQVVRLLSSKRISSTRDMRLFRPGDVCVISAHGISPRVRDALKSTGAGVCDASCPDVLKVQGIIRKHARQGYATIIFGDEGHTEVEGLLGFTEGRGFVINRPDGVEKLPDLGLVCLVSQTTQNRDEYRQIAAAVKARFREALVFETICASTLDRQKEVVDIAAKVDALIVVGGGNSANTARLTRIAGGRIPVFQVETADELDPVALSRFQTVGVTAGASTPNWLIQEVVERLRSCSWERQRTKLGRLCRLLSVIVKANVLIALGGACLTCAAARLLKIPVQWPAVLLSFCLVLAVYNLNIFADQSAIHLSQPSRYRFFLRYRKELYLLNTLSLLAAFWCAGILGAGAFLLTVFTLLSGLAYSFTLLPSTLPGRSLKHLTGLKEFFSSLGWGVLAVLIPAFSARVPAVPVISVLVVFIFVFSVMFVRSSLFAIRDIQGDRLVGRETIPVVLGVRKTKIMLLGLITLVALLLILGAARGWVDSSGYWYLGVIAYGCFYLVLYHRRIIFRGLAHEMLVDSQLLLAGLIAFLAR